MPVLAERVAEAFLEKTILGVGADFGADQEERGSDQQLRPMAEADGERDEE